MFGRSPSIFLVTSGQSSVEGGSVFNKERALHEKKLFSFGGEIIVYAPILHISSIKGEGPSRGKLYGLRENIDQISSL